MASIPQVQTAIVITSKDEDLQVRRDYPVKQPDELAPGECLVKMLATGVCQSGTPSGF
jgi:propanol-preferring alcohol dehydrogenase